MSVGIPLRDAGGHVAGNVDVSTSGGATVDLSQYVGTGATTARVVARLSPGEARELAGALAGAADSVEGRP